MKQKTVFLLVTIVCIITCHSASAKVWRVNNISNYNGSNLWGDNAGGSAVYPVFAEIDEAVNFAEVLAGDTLHIEGSLVTYATATVTKRLVIIGAGYFLTENPNTSNNFYPAHVNDIILSYLAGQSSSGSRVMGVWANSIGVQDVNDIVIKNCKIDGAINFTGFDIFNVQVLKNYIEAGNGGAFAYNGSNGGLDVIFNNNICKKTLHIPAVSSLLECKNNVFDCPEAPVGQFSIDMHTLSFQNNILKNPDATTNLNDGTNLNVSYNTAASPDQFGTANNNIVADMSALFVNPALNSSDGDYKLNSGSAQGSDGTERGAFGGLNSQNRYSLSGLGPIPVIYDISTSGVSDAGELPVTIKARAIQ